MAAISVLRLSGKTDKEIEEMPVCIADGEDTYVAADSIDFSSNKVIWIK